MEWIDAILKLSQVGSTALLLIALFGAYKGWWVPGRIYDECDRRGDAWREMYTRERDARDLDRGQSLEEVADAAARKAVDAVGRVRP